MQPNSPNNRLPGRREQPGEASSRDAPSHWTHDRRLPLATGELPQIPLMRKNHSRQAERPSGRGPRGWALPRGRGGRGEGLPSGLSRARPAERGRPAELAPRRLQQAQEGGDGPGAPGEPTKLAAAAVASLGNAPAQTGSGATAFPEQEAPQ